MVRGALGVPAAAAVIAFVAGVRVGQGASSADRIRAIGMQHARELRKTAEIGHRMSAAWERHYASLRRWYDPPWSELGSRTNPRLEAARRMAMSEAFR